MKILITNKILWKLMDHRLLWELKLSRYIIYLIRSHDHHLKYVNYKDKKSSAYSGGWICNTCSKRFSANVDNLYCGICNFDICQDCFIRENQR
jgi:hypothetical protein